jgi:hypothetical protein
VRVFLIKSAVLSLSLAIPALAYEGGGDGSDQPITTESSAESTQDPALWRALLVEENQPDEDQGALRDLDSLETQASEELALEELRVMDAQTEEELLYQTTERSVEVSRLPEVERSGTRSNSGVLTTGAAVAGVGGLGFVGGVFVGYGACLAAVDDPLECIVVGGSAGGAVGALLGVYLGFRWARPNSSNGSSNRDVEQGDSQGIGFLPYPLAIVGGITVLFGSDNILDGDTDSLLLTAGGVGMVGAAVYLARRNSRSEAGESPISLSVSPYRHDDASGLMFSGQF